MINFKTLWDNLQFIWNIPFLFELLISISIAYVFLGALLYTSNASLIEKSFTSEYKPNTSLIIVDFSGKYQEAIPFKKKNNQYPDIKITFDASELDDHQNNVIKIIQR